MVQGDGCVEMPKPVCLACQRADQVIKTRPKMADGRENWGCKRCGLEWKEDRYNVPGARTLEGGKYYRPLDWRKENH